jgi:hypothetical protein
MMKAHIISHTSCFTSDRVAFLAQDKLRKESNLVRFCLDCTLRPRSVSEKHAVNKGERAGTSADFVGSKVDGGRLDLVFLAPLA